MKITVINATEKRGVTWRMKEIFLEKFRQSGAEITEYCLPKDGPGFCTGCTSCILNGEESCKDAEKVGRIETSLREADLIVMCSPAYVMHTTGAMKTLLDHLAYRWMPHRPAREMFGKRAVIITQCLGAGAKSTAKDIKDSLSWWGVPDIRVFSVRLMGDVVWDKLSETKRAAITKGLGKLAGRYADKDYTRPARAGLVTRIKFSACRMMQGALHRADPESMDGKYWAEQGWLEKKRPWRGREDDGP